MLLNNGTRIFLRVYSLRKGSGSDRTPYAFIGDVEMVPVGIEIAYIRNAPSVETIRYVRHHMHTHSTWIDVIYIFHLLFNTFCYVSTVREVTGILQSDLATCND